MHREKTRKQENKAVSQHVILITVVPTRSHERNISGKNKVLYLLAQGLFTRLRIETT